MNHITTLFDLSRDAVLEIFELTAQLKSETKRGERKPLLAGRLLVQLFEKPSLRTRISFDAAMQQLGGGSSFLSTAEAGLNGRESVADVARVLSGYADVIAMRTFSQSVIEEVAEHCACPVINALSDEHHPCQALSDLFTVQELFGSLPGRRIAYIGDGNNVASSLAGACAMLGLPLTVAAPEGYQLTDEILADIRQRFPDADLTQGTDPFAAVSQADVVYTDVWASMGQEREKEQRNEVFAKYQINAELLAAAPARVKFLHCLPARRGLEVTDDVVEGPASAVFQQAENRMHLAKGLLVWLLGAA